jgi:LemA protein
MTRRLLVLALALSLSACGYNQIQELDENVDARRADIEAELLRRNDLIPNLVATVQEAARFEEETFVGVAQARAGLDRARQDLDQAVRGDAPAPELARASSAVGENLRLFLNVAVEAYPQLTANRSFIGLQDELTETENRLAVARRDYNESVQRYNTYIRQFPQAMTARVVGAQRRAPFEAPAGTDAAPRVDFERGPRT